MSRLAVARNYAETLLELAVREDAAEAYVDGVAEMAELVQGEPVLGAFFVSPRISLNDKRVALREVCEGRYPKPLVRFLLVVLEKGRQSLLPEIAEEARSILDDRSDRQRVSVTLALDPDETLRREIVDSLSSALGRSVQAVFQRDDRIVGGMVVRAGDRVLDGSLRRRIQLLRRSLLISDVRRRGTSSAGT